MFKSYFLWVNGFSKNKKIVSYSFKYHDSKFRNGFYDALLNNCVQLCIRVLIAGTGSSKVKRILSTVVTQYVPNTIYYTLCCTSLFAN